LQGASVIMDRAYEGDETRQLVLERGMTPVVPQKRNRLTPWEYNHERYKKRNEVERLFRRLKGFRRIFSRFDKLDVVFTFFIHFALIVNTLFSVNRP
jgi:transposase